MIRKIDVGSVFGTAQRTSYEYMKLLKEKHKDGLQSLPFAHHESKVVMYESNKIYINGGIIDNEIITPISNRKYYKENLDKIEIRNKNFYFLLKMMAISVYFITWQKMKMILVILLKINILEKVKCKIILIQEYGKL